MIRFWDATGVPARKRRVAVALIEIAAGRDGAEVTRIFPMRRLDWRIGVPWAGVTTF